MARQRFLSAVFKDKEDMTAALGSTVSRQQDVRLSSASDNFIIPTMMTETQLPFVEAGSFFYPLLPDEFERRSYGKNFKNFSPRLNFFPFS